MPLGLSFGNCLGLGGHLSQDLMANTRYWDPSDIDTLAWYDASDNQSNQTNPFGLVSQWNDLSGNNFHLTAGQGFEPDRSTQTRNSLPVNDFNGGPFMAVANFNPGNGDVGIYFVANVTASNSINDSILSLVEANLQFNANNNVGFNGVLVKNTGADRIVTGGANPINGYAVYSLVIDQANAQIQVYLNGTQLGQTRADNSPGLIISQLNMGADTTLASPMTGQIAEVVFEDSVETNKRQTIEGYLAHKWGLEGQLPDDHPFNQDPPGIVEIAQTQYLSDETGNIMYDNGGNPIVVQG